MMTPAEYQEQIQPARLPAMSPPQPVYRVPVRTQSQSAVQQPRPMQHPQQLHQQPQYPTPYSPPAQRSTRPYSAMPALPAPVDPLYQIFTSVDKDGSGRLSAGELRSALVNFDKTKFDPETIKLMIKLFDSDGSGTIDYTEFKRLWNYLGEWLEQFQRFDLDHNTTISLDEFSLALQSFGFHFTPNFVRFMFNHYDKRGTGSISFDLFVQANINLQRIYDAFKKYDSGQGTIQIGFEDLLTEVLYLK
ncbi:hypothetical protein V1517DRAFT_316961 [Lipomyces orientalis]|uniref:Uncharacterized protein n=1 Tax=Lipomyces orientalis TaxID=1233043 RepID=A0ACC3TV37_9ASCO